MKDFFKTPIEPPEQLDELAVRPIEQDATFVSNIELVLGNDRVTGSLAKKVREVSQRALWYPDYEHIVLPEAPDPSFAWYVGTLGLKPNIVVPDGIDPYNLSMRDAFVPHQPGNPKEPSNFAKAIQGRMVESFVLDQKLASFVNYCGGTYPGGPPGDRPSQANNKALFADYSQGIVQVPKGKKHTGLDNVAAAVKARLAQGKDTFVRHTQSGGGFGNRSFTKQSAGKMSLAEIRSYLVGDHPESWENATVLVEEHLGRITQSPAVTFGWTGFLYDNLQLTQNGDYRGSISPVPPEVANARELQYIGDAFSASLRQKINYYGPGNVDLGLMVDRKLIGFECNARFTGARHVIAIGELLVGPWKNWRENNDVAVSVDHFTLNRTMDFDQLYDILDREELLATKAKPQGVVISIPPRGRVAGVHIQGKGYQNTVALHREIVKLTGDPVANTYDNPLNFSA
ncbi:MAG TPA: hypothetical protein VF733_02790 [Candidatus Saccharimonadales bacterium]